MGKSFNQEDIEVISQSEELMLDNEDCIIIRRIRYKKEKEFLDIRRYYMNDAGTYLPSNKGLWIPISNENDKKFAETLIDTMEILLGIQKEESEEKDEI